MKPIKHTKKGPINNILHWFSNVKKLKKLQKN